MHKYIFITTALSLAVFANNALAADPFLWKDHSIAKRNLLSLIGSPYGDEGKQTIARLGIAETYLIADGVGPENEELVSKYAVGLDLMTPNGRGAFIYRVFRAELAKKCGFTPSVKGALNGSYRVSKGEKNASE